MTTNDDLQQVYDEQYAAGYAAAHTPVDCWEESMHIFQLGTPWRHQTVLEIGCGEGRLAAFIAWQGAYHVTGLDYSAAAIEQARSRWPIYKHLQFTTEPVSSLGHFDVIVMQGVLEHLDEPWLYLTELYEEHLYPHGHILTSSPSFLNPRGYVWQTLRLLLDVPMSLTDLHAINPWDMQAWADAHHMPLSYSACHRDWAAGRLMLTDYARRLPKALADAWLPTDGVPRLLAWLEQACGHFKSDYLTGATMVYKLGPKS